MKGPANRTTLRGISSWWWLRVIAVLVVIACEPSMMADTSSLPDVSASVTTTTPLATTTSIQSTTRPPTTSHGSVPDGSMPQRAIAQVDAHLAWIEVGTGETEVIFEYLFEAAWASPLALASNGSHVYYGLGVEDYWFSCQTVYGLVTALDLATGARTTIAPGRPAFSPGGDLFGYLTSDQCYPDPTQPEFFATYFDTLVITDLAGAEIARFSLGTEVGTEGTESLINLVWLDQETIVVTDARWVHYLVPVGAGGQISHMDTVELPALLFGAVVDGIALGAAFDPNTGQGPLQTVDLDRGEVRPIAAVTRGPYEMGISAADQLIVTATSEEGARVVLVDLDLTTGEAATTIEVEGAYAIDW
ncbi:MAG TPA: hypothetical protein VJR05_04560 [Acidimicrobiia bacterium]|nr:hypothetical protein [Acidimicrobiia bacterium]